jgi:putative Mg2+ transporter-C (MgtC) family protein
MDFVFEQREELTLVAWPLLARLFVAFLCGALIGSERGHSGKPAGLRTNILICVGAAMYTMSSELSAKFVAGAPVEAARITAQVVTGVGFIGAGAILRSGLAITGMTTAATIWLVAAIGVLIGLGFPFLGLTATLLTLVTLFVFGQFPISGRCEMRVLALRVPADRPVTLARVETAIRVAGAPATLDSVREVDGAHEVTFRYCTRHAEHAAFLSDVDAAL